MYIKQHARIATALCLAASAVCAQPTDGLRNAVEQAVNTNPEIASRFSAYRASADAVDVARAGYFPRLDATASIGRENERNSGLNPENRNTGRSAAGLSLTQLLWDGLGTRRDVARSGHERLARYFELRDTTEQVALEAARAHFDVQRYRRLVQLAEDNYVQHRYAFLQIQSRVKAGVGRGVDLEQANARIALAESNLTSEIANLHDVTVRFQRIVGAAPSLTLPPTTPLRDGVPPSASEAMAVAVRQSAAISASIESLRASRSLVEAREAAYQPRVEARLRSSVGRNLDGIQDQSRSSTAEIVLNWNLFNGGADQARVRQQTHLLRQAGDLRDKACRDTRQVTAIAYNDTRKLADQLVFLDRNTVAIEKARDAYRQQFDIGQRSLLDLLNAENEVYTARRSFANARFDLDHAFARTHASMYQLVAQVGLSPTDSSSTEAEGWTQGDDAPTRCPLIPVEVGGVGREELDARAAKLTTGTPPPAPPPGLAPRPAPAKPPTRRP